MSTKSALDPKDNNITADGREDSFRSASKKSRLKPKSSSSSDSKANVTLDSKENSLAKDGNHSTQKHSFQSQVSSGDNILGVKKDDNQNTGHPLKVHPDHADNDVSLFFKKSGVLVNVEFSQDSVKNNDIESEVVQVESMDDVSWKEVRIDHSKLRQHYMRLAKIRLTGNVLLCFVCLT